MGIGVALAIFAAALGVAFVALDEPRPTSRPGPAAEALTARIERAIDLAAWERTGAVRWTFAGGHRHLWDRTRSVARVEWGDTRVLLYVGGPRGRAYRGARELGGDEARAALETAYAYWINDSFWLNPLAKLRDEGVTRGIVRVGGEDALLVHYASGGLTPGDAYLWIPGENDLPRAWRMWVSVILVGGVEASWEGWTTLSTGARIATRHTGPLGLALELTDVEGAATLAELVDGPDPFAPLFARGGR